MPTTGQYFNIKNVKNRNGNYTVDFDYRYAQRESYIFQLINLVESDNYNPDGAHIYEDGKITNRIYNGYNRRFEKLPFDAKCRLRNEIIRNIDAMSDLSDDDKYTENTINEAFFMTHYGKKFADQKDTIIEDSKNRGFYNLATNWNNSESISVSNGKCSFVGTVSPYDPYFANIFKGIYARTQDKSDSDLFRVDEIKYLSNTFNVNENIDNIPIDFLCSPTMCNAVIDSNNMSTKAFDRYTLANKSDLQKFNSELHDISNGQASIRNMGGKYLSDYVSSFTGRVFNYIKNDEQKNTFFNAIDSIYAGRMQNNMPVKPIEQEFDYAYKAMKAMSEHGFEYDIVVKNMNDGNIKIDMKLSNVCSITLVDRDNPKYEGQIYDKGHSYYLSPDSNSYKSSDEAARTAKRDSILSNIDVDDKLNFLKYYFGLGNAYINEHDGNNVKTTNTEIGNYFVEVGNKKTKRPVIAKVMDGRNIIDISMMTKNLSDSDLNNEAVRTKILPLDGIFEKDYDKYVAENIQNEGVAYKILTNENGDDEKIWFDKDVSSNFFKSVVNMTDEVKDYYTALANRNKLAEWVESAKSAYKEEMQIDDLIEAVRDTVVNNSDEISFVQSSDESVAAIQKTLIDFLKDGKGLYNNDTDADDTLYNFITNKYPNIDANNIGFDDRVTIVHDYANIYLDKVFGNVPKIIVTDDVVDNRANSSNMMNGVTVSDYNASVEAYNKTCTGFDPEMVANYVKIKSNNDANIVNSSNSLSKNYDCIEHMLHEMGDFYTPDFIKDGTYMADVIKNDLIKYDAKKSLVKQDLNYYNFFDSKGNIKYAKYSDGRVKRDKNNNKIPAIMDEFEGFKGKPATAEMLIHTVDCLVKCGADKGKIHINIDSNGIIKYSADANMYGEIGQIVEPDKNGAICPVNADGSHKYAYIPGYNGAIMPNDIDEYGNEKSTIRERLRLYDWKHDMRDAIYGQIRDAFAQTREDYNFTPHTTSLNRVYSHMNATQFRYEEYRDKFLEPNVDPDDPNRMSYSKEEIKTNMNILKTLKGRVRFPTSYIESMTTASQAALENPTKSSSKLFDLSNSDQFDNKNMRVLGEEFDGIFDPYQTATAKNQGVVRYLADVNVRIDPTTGKIENLNRLDKYDKNDPPVCALTKDPIMKYIHHNTWDRMLMASTQLMTALHTPRNVGVGMLTCKGDNFDDGITVSKAFADEYKILAPDGNVRSLIVQDKLSDMNGNKGVITRIVDPSMHSSMMIKDISFKNEDVSALSPVMRNGKPVEGCYYDTVIYRDNSYTFKYNENLKNAKGQPISREQQAIMKLQRQLHVDDDICKVFADNPNLDVIMSPYSGMSRANGGTIRSLLESQDPEHPEKTQLKLNGKTIQGGMGYMDMIVVDMPADVKTHIYDEDSYAEGKGRRASGQLIWALNSKGANEVLHEMFGKNDGAWNEYREYAIAIGMDLTEDFKPTMGYHEQSERGEHRRLFELMDIDRINSDEFVGSKSKSNSFNKNAGIKIKADILSKLDMSGGFMELPFQLKFDRKISNKGITDLDIYKNNEGLMELPDKYELKGASDMIDYPSLKTYGLPVLSSRLRSGCEFQDGTRRSHDYTNQYAGIYENAVKYVKYYKEAVKCDRKNDTVKKAQYEKLMSDCKNKAQEKFDTIVSDIIDRRFDTKHNCIREGLMSRRMPASGTAVISADASLNCDQVGMSKETALALGIIKEDKNSDDYHFTGDGKVLLARDPILRDSGVKYMNVVISDNIKGIAINPVMGKPFDGDFDGDSYAVFTLNSKKARQQAQELFSVKKNLLDLGVKDESGKYPLAINVGLDVKAAIYDDPKLKKKYDDITTQANKLQEFKEKVAAGTESVDDYKFKVKRKDKDGAVREVEYRGREAVEQHENSLMKHVNILVKKSLKHIGADHIVVESPKTVVDSLNHIVADGAKGNIGKMGGLLDQIGIKCEKQMVAGGDKVAEAYDATTADMFDFTKRDVFEQREFAKRIQETSAYKADDTALGGTMSQLGISALRNIDPKGILELTYPVTQSILQSKHNPEDAKIKDTVTRYWGRDLWNGCKLTGDWSETDPDKLATQEHIPIKRQSETDPESYYDEKCTPDEWCVQMEGMFKALKVDINHDYIKKIADELTDKRQYVNDKPNPNYNKIMGLQTYMQVNGSLMDNIAYQGKYKAFVNASISDDSRTIVSNADKHCVSSRCYDLMASMCSKRIKSLGDSDENLTEALNKYRAACYDGSSSERSKLDGNASIVSDNVANQMILDKCRAIIEHNPGSGITMDDFERYVGVRSKPIGNRDSLVSNSDYENATCRVVGESKEDYMRRCEAAKARNDVPKQNSPLDYNDHKFEKIMTVLQGVAEGKSDIDLGGYDSPDLIDRNAQLNILLQNMVDNSKAKDDNQAGLG